MNLFFLNFKSFALLLFFLVTTTVAFPQKKLNNAQLRLHVRDTVQVIGFDDTLNLSTQYLKFYKEVIKSVQPILNYKVDNNPEIKADIIFETSLAYGKKSGKEFFDKEVYIINVKCVNNYTSKIVAERFIVFSTYKEVMYNRIFKDMIINDSLGVIYLLKNIFYRPQKSAHNKDSINPEYAIFFSSDETSNKRFNFITKKVKKILLSCQYDYPIIYLKAKDKYKYKGKEKIIGHIIFKNPRKNTVLVTLSFSSLDKSISSKDFIFNLNNYGDILDSFFSINKFIYKTISQYVAN